MSRSVADKFDRIMERATDGDFSVISFYADPLVLDVKLNQFGFVHQSAVRDNAGRIDFQAHDKAGSYRVNFYDEDGLELTAPDGSELYGVFRSDSPFMGLLTAWGCMSEAFTVRFDGDGLRVSVLEVHDIDRSESLSDFFEV
jgi:hypothetical protein